MFAYLFGGLARQTTSPIADLDIALYFEEDVDMVEEKLVVLGQLMERLDTDEIDLVVLNTAPLPLKARVIQNKQVLVDRKPFLRHVFESLALREYFDFFLEERAIFDRKFFHDR